MEPVNNLEDVLALLRSKGWRVAVHNDYRQDGKDYTFWLFTNGNVAVKGEGPTDLAALKIIASHPLVSGAYPTAYEHARWFNANPGFCTDDEAVASLATNWVLEDLEHGYDVALRQMGYLRDQEIAFKTAARLDGRAYIPKPELINALVDAERATTLLRQAAACRESRT